MTEEAWVEAVALATLNDLRVSGGWPPLIEIPEGFQDADEWRAQARAAIRAVGPLLIEQCAEVATGWAKRLKKVDGCGPMVATAEDIAEGIRALLGTEA